jgi:hypothetical protein
VVAARHLDGGVATTFSTDTPNLVTDMVRNGGVSLNWLWWDAFLRGFRAIYLGVFFNIMIMATVTLPPSRLPASCAASTLT